MFGNWYFYPNSFGRTSFGTSLWSPSRSVPWNMRTSLAFSVRNGLTTFIRTENSLGWNTKWILLVHRGKDPDKKADAKRISFTPRLLTIDYISWKLYNILEILLLDMRQTKTRTIQNYCYSSNLCFHLLDFSQ